MSHSARSSEDSAVLIALQWRTGGSVGRTIYAVRGDLHAHARDDDSCMIGVMDSAELAHEVVATHNRLLDERRWRAQRDPS